MEANEQQDELLVIKRSDLIHFIRACGGIVMPNIVNYEAMGCFPASEVFEAGFTKGGIWQSSPEDKRDVDLAIKQTYQDYEKEKI